MRAERTYVHSPRMKEVNHSTNYGKESSSSLSRRSILGGIGVATALSVLPSVSAQEGSSDEEFDPIEANSWEILQGYATGELTAESVVESYLDRIYQYEDELNGVITINPNALERARELDEAAEPGGLQPEGTLSPDARGPQNLVGPLHGIPVLVKDNINTEDLPTTTGAVALKDTTPEEDAPIVQNIRDAGGIVIAKANMDEFAFGYTSSSSMAGTAYNPYNTERTAGGSSGGTGCGIGANYATIGIGTDTGGSIQIPSLSNALVGIRPTTQLLSGDGVSPLNARQDVAGPMARTVADAAIMLDVLAATDPGDTMTYHQYKNTPHANGDQYVDYLNEDGLDGARIGVYTDWLPDPEVVGSDVRDAFDDALATMRAAGATIVSQLETPPAELDAAYRGATTNYDWENYLETIPGFETIEDIVTTGETESCGLAGNIGDPNTVDELLEETAFSNPYYWQRRLQEYILEQMDEADLDAIMFAGNWDVPTPDYSEGLTWGAADNQLSPKTDWPTITVPVTYNEEGAPIGMQLLGPKWSEPQLISLAYSYEQADTVREPPEDFGSVEAGEVEWDVNVIEQWNEDRIVYDTVDEPCEIDLDGEGIEPLANVDTRNLPGGSSGTTQTTDSDTESSDEGDDEPSDEGDDDIDTGNLPS